MAIKDTFDKVKKSVDRFLFKDPREQGGRVPAGGNQQPQQEAYAPDPYTQGPYVPQGQFIPQSQYTQPQYTQQAQYAQQTQYSQPQYAQNPYTAQPMKTDANGSVPMPNAAAGAEIAAEPDRAAGIKPQNTDQAMYVLSARSIRDCHNAISILRTGAIVLLVMEGVTDTGDMRRFVDTLSGACFSLSATISKVSHHGSYLLVPKNVSLMLDQVVNQMNISPRARMRQQMQSQPYGAPQQSPYQNNPYPPQQSPYMNGAAYQQNAYQPQQTQTAVLPAYDPQTAFAQGGYDPRMQGNMEAGAQQPGPMVERVPVRPSAMPVFERQYGTGYVPETEE